MVPAPAAGRTRATRALLALALGAAGCVTEYERDPTVSWLGGDERAANAAAAALAVPVSIPIPDAAGGRGPVYVEFYGSVLRRLQDAAEDGDVAMIEALLQRYERPDLPEALAAQLRGFRAAARGIAFQQHVAQQGRLILVPGAGDPPDGRPGPTPVLGEPLRLQLELPAAADPVRLPGADEADPVCFLVTVAIDDDFVDGGARSSDTEEFLRLPRSFDLSGDAVLTLPLEVGAAAGDAVRRTVFVSVELLGGHVEMAGERAPVRRVTAAAGSWTMWPKGHEIVAEAPLRVLRQAMVEFTPAHYASAWVAAALMPEADRRTASAMLIDQVRFGRLDQARVAMAALRRMNGVDLSVGDRDAWLAWWQARR